MVNQRHCPFCGRAAMEACDHLALAVPGRDFVRCCIDAAQAVRQWQALCALVRQQRVEFGQGGPDSDDFTWLETAFCNMFLKNLRWFGGIDHEWRTGGQLDKGGFYVLLWSKSPKRLWWELSDQVGHQLETVKEGRQSFIGTVPYLPGRDPRQLKFGRQADL